MRQTHHRWALPLALLVTAPLVAGCSGGMSDMFSKDANWFSRPGRLFIRNVSIDAPPLTPNRPITPEDLVSGDGACAGMPPPGTPADTNAPADANASTDPASAPPPVTTGTVALGHTECDVVRGIGAPDSVNISNDASGERVAVVTWTHGPRAGIYTFNAGRLKSIEGVPAPPEPPKAAKKHKAKKKPAPT